MRKLFVFVLAGLLCVAVSASATSTKTKTEVKDTTTGATVEKTVTTTPEETATTTKVKGKNIKMEKQQVATKSNVTGTTTVKIKKGALSDLKINYNYYQKGTEYVLDYNVTDKSNKNLRKELGLTADEAKMLKPGKHTITSTSPYTVSDVRSDFHQLIINDLKNAVHK